MSAIKDPVITTKEISTDEIAYIAKIETSFVPLVPLCINFNEDVTYRILRVRLLVKPEI